MNKYLLIALSLLLVNSAEASVDELINAVKSNDLSAVRTLVKSGENVNAVNDQGNSALHYAVAMDNAEMTRLLLQAGANVNVENTKGWSPIKIAEKKNVKNVTAVLAEELQKEREEAQKIAVEQAQKVKQQAVVQTEKEVAEEKTTPDEVKTLKEALAKAENSAKVAEDARLKAEQALKELQEKLQKSDQKQSNSAVVSDPKKVVQQVQSQKKVVAVNKPAVKAVPQPQPKKVVVRNSNFVQGIYAGDEEIVYCLNLLGQGENKHLLAASPYFAAQSGMTEARYNQIRDLSNQFFAQAQQGDLKTYIDTCSKIITPADKNKQNLIIRSINHGIGVK